MASRQERRDMQDRQRQHKLLAGMGPAASEIILVRHGETDWNKELRIQGQMKPGPPLNDVGRQQAQEIAAVLESETLDIIYSSDLLRAIETAEAIASRKLGIQVCTSEALRERNMGILQGLSLAEASVKHPTAFEVLRRADQHMRVPGGESVVEMMARCAAAVEGIAAQHPGQRVLLVVHGGVLHALYQHAVGHAYHGKVVNCSMHTLRVEGTRWAVVQWNQTAHLESVGYLGQAFGGGAGEA